MLTGDPETDEIANLSFEEWSALVVRRADLEMERFAVEYDGPPTERDLFPAERDTWAPATCPTLPAIYSREAA